MTLPAPFPQIARRAGRLLASILLFAAAASGAASLEHIDPGVRDLLALPEKVETGAVEFTVNRSPEESGILAIRALGPALDAILVEVTFEEPPHFSLADLTLLIDLDGNPATGERMQGRDGVDTFARIVNQTVGTNSRLVGEAAEAGGDVRVLQDRDRVYLLARTPWLAAAPNPAAVRVYGRYRRPRVGAGTVIFVSSRGELQRGDTPGPDLPETLSRMVRPPSAYRFWTDHGLHAEDPRAFAGRVTGIAYEKREDKGLARHRVEPDEPGAFGREKPLPAFLSGSGAAAPRAVAAAGSVPVEVVEEYGADRRAAPLTFGAPFAQGEVFCERALTLRGPDGAALPASFPVTVRWPDGSIRWILADTRLDIGAGERRELTLAWTGKAAPPANPDWWEETEAGYAIDTGPLRTLLPTDRFQPLTDLHIRAGDTLQPGPVFPEGLVLVDEHGARHTTAAAAPDRVTIEIATAHRLVFRVEGGYVDAAGNRLQRYIARIGFRRDSARIDLVVTHMNDALDFEFTDIRSLTLPIRTVSPIVETRLALEDGSEAAFAAGVEVFQADDRTASLTDGAGQRERFGRLPHAFTLRDESGAAWGAVVEDAWQRWPKGLVVGEDRVEIHLLPPQRDETFGSDLPGHLAYAFSGGTYRMKWGMSFTERLLLDFSGEAAAIALAAEGQRPLVAVLPAERHARTGAFGDVGLADDALARQWDAFFEESFLRHEERRERQQEYGFLNYGDWFGERGRNWGNNEYDTAHAFFSQFVRTGDRRYFRSALAAARHQADVDIVHAYPDPAHVGAMHMHSIGHTGPSSHLPTHGVWSIAFGNGVYAGNGHTWAEGMAQAWFLKGDAPVMESLIGLGEHIAWFMAPAFEMDPGMPRRGGWSLRAASAVYRATGDPVHLAAAERIALQSREHQHPGGGWFRERPEDRADPDAEESPAVTNFQMGVILGGFREYHRLTGDTRVEPTMARAAEFMRRAWDEHGGWYYWMTPEGGPHAGRNEFLYGVYGYTADGVAYAGRVLLGDPAYEALARQAFAAQMENHEIVAAGQRIGYSLRGGNSLLAEIAAFGE